MYAYTSKNTPHELPETLENFCLVASSDGFTNGSLNSGDSCSLTSSMSNTSFSTSSENSFFDSRRTSDLSTSQDYDIPEHNVMIDQRVHLIDVDAYPQSFDLSGGFLAQLEENNKLPMFHDAFVRHPSMDLSVQDNINLAEVVTDRLNQMHDTQFRLNVSEVAISPSFTNRITEIYFFEEQTSLESAYHKILQDIREECTQTIFIDIKIYSATVPLLKHNQPSRWTPEESQIWLSSMLHKFRDSYQDAVQLATVNHATIASYIHTHPLVGLTSIQLSDLLGPDLGGAIFQQLQRWRVFAESKKNTRKLPKQKKTTRKRRAINGLYLWQHILSLLLNPTEHHEVIHWIDESNGQFEIIQSDQVSLLWGETKNNKKMNYEKMSRSLRQYYVSGLLKKSTGRRLVYQFDMKNPIVIEFLSTHVHS